MRNGFVATTALILACCASSSKKSEPPPILATSTSTITDEMMGRSKGTMQLTRSATDPQYGFSETKSVKIGGGFDTGTERTYQFLNALRGPNGEMVHYTRIGTCCGFKTPNSPFGSGLLEVYAITYEGLEKPKRLYFNWYEEGDVLVPVGLTFAR